MPIHLPPITRRRFLGRSLTAGAGLLIAPKLAAASRQVDPAFWALLSDIHIAADPAKVARSVNMTDHFQAVAREVLALPRRPAGVFINGDCAFNSGEKADYAQVLELLKPLREDEL